MKLNIRSITIIATIMVTLLLSGCKKYLDLKPQNSITRENFFKTKDDAVASIVGTYDALQGCVTQFLNWGEYRADLVAAGSSNDVTYPYYQFMDKLKPVSDWSAVYNMIGRANTVIEFVPGIPAVDDKFSVDDSKKIVAEAQFLRALGYFYLVRTFKEVPLVLQAPSNDQVNFFVPKATADSVLNQVEADLTAAEAVIPVTYEKNNDTRGRATAGAVHALQADVYLWRGKYQQAAVAAQKVLDATSIYSLVPSASWFNIYSQKNTAESILEVQFDNSIQETNGLISSANNFTMNNVLKTYFDGATDVVRGLNNTYINGATWWKYSGLTTTTMVARPTNDPNFILYRLPDIMLMKAEALSHLGSFDQKTEAIQLMDAVRVRAGVSPYGIYLDGNAPYSLLIELIVQERAMELALEGKRWFDLVRIATNDKNPDFLIDRVVKSRSVGDRSLIKSRIIDPRSWYMPISQYELNRNPQLVQNPYYK
ncbi:RagB/SusD family nutrient uptake outer membrane protein [Ferruginibacter sp.]